MHNNVEDFWLFGTTPEIADVLHLILGVKSKIQDHRIAEWFDLEGTSEDPLVQPSVVGIDFFH